MFFMGLLRISKVYYHLGAMEEAVQFALKAGNLFDISSHSEFVDTIIGTDARVLDDLRGSRQMY